MNEHAIELIFPSLSVNEGFARAVIGAFAVRMNPTLEQLSDLKTAVSEAVTNAIVHGYPGTVGDVILTAEARGRTLVVTVADRGCGIDDVAQARAPFFTTRPEEERSGMGFMVMEAFCDRVEVLSSPGQGTTVTLVKTLLPPAVDHVSSR